MQIKELLKNNKISLRTYNICMEQQWHSSEDIRNYYNEYKHFDGIKKLWQTFYGGAYAYFFFGFFW